MFIAQLDDTCSRVFCYMLAANSCASVARSHSDRVEVNDVIFNKQDKTVTVRCVSGYTMPSGDVVRTFDCSCDLREELLRPDNVCVDGKTRLAEYDRCGGKGLYLYVEKIYNAISVGVYRRMSECRLLSIVCYHDAYW